MQHWSWSKRSEVMLENYGSWSHWEFRFGKPKLIIQHEWRRQTLERGKKTSTGIHPPKSDKVSSVSTVATENLFCILSYDYLKNLFGPGKGTKVSYNLFTLSYEYQFISLSISAVQDKTSMLCPQICVIQTWHKHTISL